MKILHIATHIGLGGAQTYVKSLACEQAKLGHKVRIVVCVKDDELTDIERHLLNLNGVVVHEIQGHSGHDLRVPYGLRKIVKAFQPDIVHFNGLPLLALLTLPWLNKARTVHTLHCIASSTFANFKSRIIARIFRPFINGLIAVSDSVERSHRESGAWSSRQIIARIYNGVDTDRFSPYDSTSTSPTRVGGVVCLVMVCRIAPVKRIDEALRLIALLKDSRSPIHFRLRIIGAGRDLIDLIDLARELDITDDVKFLGAQTNVAFHLRGTHGMLVLSDYESFCLSALEAMACGIPVFSYPIDGGFHEFHQDGFTGRVTKTRSVGELATMLTEAFTDEVAMKAFQKNCLDVSQGFSLRAMCENTVGFYHALLNRRTRMHMDENNPPFGDHYK